MRYLFVCLIAGCAQEMVWTKPDYTDQQFYQERGQCQAQALSAPGMPPFQVAAIFNACMAGKGYYKEPKL